MLLVDIASLSIVVFVHKKTAYKEILGIVILCVYRVLVLEHLIAPMLMWFIEV